MHLLYAASMSCKCLELSLLLPLMPSHLHRLGLYNISRGGRQSRPAASLQRYCLPIMQPHLNGKAAIGYAGLIGWSC